ncbi:hypothetical protein QQ045_031150 [Rhodiola kirilowii]
MNIIQLIWNIFGTMDMMKLPPSSWHLQKRARLLDGYLHEPCIPDDIIFEEILKWNKRIRSKDFIEQHLKYHSLKKDSHLLLTNSNHEFYKRSLSIMRLQENGTASIEATYSCPPLSYSLKRFHLYKFKLVSICRGLVCAIASARNSRFPQVIFVWNPFTMAYKEFPYPALKSEALSGVYGKPSICLGYDQVNDDYKIVLVGIRINSDGPLHIEIMSLESKVWRTLETTDENRPAGAVRGLTTTQTVATEEGCLYLALTVGLRLDAGIFQVFKFSLSDYKFTRLQDPPIAPLLEDGNYKIGLYNGSLCLYHMSGDNVDRFGRNVDIWEYKPNGIWTKVMHIPEELSHEDVPGYKWSRRRDQQFDVGVVISRFAILHRTWQYTHRYGKSDMWRRSLSLHDPKDEHVRQLVSLDHLHQAFGADSCQLKALFLLDREFPGGAHFDLGTRLSAILGSLRPETSKDLRV